MVKGQRAEGRVVNSLRRSGAKVEQSPGSRGSADATAKWEGGKEWLVQVKSSRSNDPAGLSSRERTNLVSRADRTGATPVVAKVTSKEIRYESARDGRKLSPRGGN